MESIEIAFTVLGYLWPIIIGVMGVYAIPLGWVWRRVNQAHGRISDRQKEIISLKDNEINALRYDLAKSQLYVERNFLRNGGTVKDMITDALTPVGSELALVHKQVNVVHTMMLRMDRWDGSEKRGTNV